ncbi:hypothetical protein MMC20_003936 [Loxospora ochrophaea]|nr:hypothetical protein [Loxospora ochrophaea]
MHPPARNRRVYPRKPILHGTPARPTQEVIDEMGIDDMDRIARGRAGRHLTTTHQPVNSASSGQQSAQSPFSNIDPNLVNGSKSQANGFGFGQSSATLQASTDNANNTAQSGSSAGFGFGGSNGFTPQLSAPSTSTFSFDTGSANQVSNPFTSSAGGSSQTAQRKDSSLPAEGSATMLSGNVMFITDPKERKEFEEGEAPPQFAPGAPFKWPGSEQTTPSIPASTTPTIDALTGTGVNAASNFFGQTANKPRRIDALTAASQSPKPQPSSVFGQPQGSQPKSNVFGQPSNQSSQTQSSGIFGQSSQKPFGNIFSQNATPKPQAQASTNHLSPEDAEMSTSPEASPQKNGGKQGGFSFLNPPSQVNQTQNSTNQSQGAGLFGRVTQPDTAPKFNFAAPVQGSGPTTNTSQTPGNSKSTSMSTPSRGLFGPIPQAEVIASINSSNSSQGSSTGFFGQAQQPQAVNGTAGSTTGASATPAPTTKASPPRAIAQPSGIFADVPRPAFTGFQTAPTVSAATAGSSPQPKNNPFAALGGSSNDQAPQPPSPSLNNQPSLIAPTHQGNSVHGFAIKGAASTTISNSSAQSSELVPATQSSLSSEQTLHALPPMIPQHLTETGKRRFITGYRLRSLDLSLKKHIINASSFSADSDAMRFYEEKKQEIFAANGSPMINQGTKRKSDSEEHLDHANLQSKRSNLNGPVLNGEGAQRPLFASSPSSNKRKADGELAKVGGSGTSDLSKKSKGNDQISYPSLPGSQSSQTSNIFKSIVSQTGDVPTLKPSEPTTANTFNATPAVENLRPARTPGNTLTSPSPYVSTPNTATAVPSYEQQFAMADSVARPTKPYLLSSSISPTRLSHPSSRPSASSAAKASAPVESSNYSPKRPSTAAASSLFSVKPSTNSIPSPVTSKPINFLAEFSEKMENEQREKRKAEDYDPDDETLEEWERRDAEEQHVKRQKLQEAWKGKGFKFTPAKESQAPQIPDVEKNNTSSNGSGVSVLANPQKPGQQSSMSANNPFAHLSDADSGAEGSKAGDADESAVSEDEDAPEENSNTDSLEQSNSDRGSSEKAPQVQGFAAVNSPQTSLKRGMDSLEEPEEQPKPSGGLFDRITRDEDGNPMRAAPSASEQKESSFGNVSKTGGLFGSSTSTSGLGNSIFAQASPPKTSDLFGKSSSNTSNLLGQSASSTTGSGLFGSSSLAGDHTWKQGTPVKFNNPNNTPSFNFTAATPNKPTSAEQKSTTPQTPFTGLFGAPKPTASETPAPSNLSTTPTKSPAVGFSFGVPPKPTIDFLAPTPDSGAATADTSRATSPGITTGAESANDSSAEGPAEVFEHHEQINLTAGGPGEEDEDVIFNVRAKASEFDSENKNWISRGLGYFRILKHKYTKKTRALMRQDPSGRVVINSALMSGMKYECVQEKAVKMGVATDQGTLATFILRVGRREDAERLASLMEAEKGN